MFLLDTNACIRILTGRPTSLVERLQQKTPREILLCSVVKAELIHGAYRSTRPAENIRLLSRFFAPYDSLPFDDRCAEAYGRICSDLERAGTVIGPNDLLIAATAVTNRLTLVTANTHEFIRVIGLEIENWELPIESDN